jgi:pyruvate kinase
MVASSVDVPTPAAPADDPAVFDRLIAELGALHDEMLSAGRLGGRRLRDVQPGHAASALNLLHYLALRRRDIRPLQERLAAAGLSSLGRSEAHALCSVEQVLEILHRLTGRPWQPGADASAVTLDEGRRLLAEHSEALFGQAPTGRSTRIMVTMPSEAADDPGFVRELLASGMDCMRINCAHDDTAAWARMIANLHAAEAELGRRCLIEMDLAGPKLRTGPVEPGPALVKLQPERDEFGRVKMPARVWLAADQLAEAPHPVAACLPLPPGWVASLGVGDEVRLTDTRGRNRRLRVISIAEGGAVVETDRTAFVSTGTLLSRKGHNDEHDPRSDDTAPIGDLPLLEHSIPLRDGDQLVLTRDLAPGRPTKIDDDGLVVEPARIGCTLPEVFAAARPGEHVWLDDGKFGGVIRTVNADEIAIEIVHAPVGGSQLRAEKGINFPDTRLSLPAMTEKDLADLIFVAAHADMIALSFVQSAADVESFYSRLDRQALDTGRRRPGLVLKIETRRAFENLPELVLAAMQGTAVGIMIARGDLAVECGFERLAEVQEEVLWLAEAAHLPVIWATQVLETEARTGQPTRAEVTDAAMGQRAECVMLNKGPFVVQAVRTLDNILRRMSSHQSKKRPMLRRLHAWDRESA